MARAVLFLIALAPLAAWTGWRPIATAVHGMCLADFPGHGGQGGLAAGVARSTRLSSQCSTLPGDNTIRNRG